MARGEWRSDLRDADLDEIWRRADESCRRVVSRYGYSEIYGEDFRFTTKGASLYAIELGWPAGGEAVIRSLGAGVGGKVESVSLLGSSEKISFEQSSDGLHIRVPAHAPGKFASAFRIAFEGGKLPAAVAAPANAAR